jgi:hypothetical protein
LKEVETAINDIKKGKAADIFGLTVENFIYGGNELWHGIITSPPFRTYMRLWHGIITPLQDICLHIYFQ